MRNSYFTGYYFTEELIPFFFKPLTRVLHLWTFRDYVAVNQRLLLCTLGEDSPETNKRGKEKGLIAVWTGTILCAGQMVGTTEGQERRSWSTGRLSVDEADFSSRFSIP